MTVFVDSDILIEVVRGRDPQVLQRWSELSDSQTAISCSPISVAELWQGALPTEHASLAKLFGALTCIPIDAETGQRAGEFLRLFRKSHGLEIPDAIIAASAVMNSALLWTRNKKHYPMKAISFF